MIKNTKKIYIEHYQNLTGNKIRHLKGWNCGLGSCPEPKPQDCRCMTDCRCSTFRLYGKVHRVDCDYLPIQFLPSSSSSPIGWEENFDKRFDGLYQYFPADVDLDSMYVEQDIKQFIKDLLSQQRQSYEQECSCSRKCPKHGTNMGKA